MFCIFFSSSAIKLSLKLRICVLSLGFNISFFCLKIDFYIFLKGPKNLLQIDFWTSVWLSYIIYRSYGMRKEWIDFVMTVCMLYYIKSWCIERDKQLWRNFRWHKKFDSLNVTLHRLNLKLLKLKGTAIFCIKMYNLGLLYCIY